MDLRILERSPEMAPLLVRLYDSHKLYNLASDETPLARAELTGAVAELLEKDLGLRERELVSDVLIDLMRQAEKDLREALAERLSTLENAPLRVILHIANDEISIARPVLKSSPVLSDLDLMYIIKGKTAEYWQEIARREQLSEQVINVLAETREQGTAMALVGNAEIQLSQKTMNILGSMAQSDEVLAKPLLMRNDLPEMVARHLYEYVGEELRNYIRTNFGSKDQAMIDAVDDVISEFTDGPARTNFMPTPAMVQAAEALAKSGRLTMMPIMDSLQRAQFGSFIAMFSKFCGLTPRTVHDMLCDPTGKILAMTCRAMNLSKADLSRIYMMTQRLRSADRIVDHNEMLRAMSIYDNVSVEKAQSVLNIFQK